MKDHLIEKAARVLRGNWKEKFTIPCEGLYPFQWNWDAGFIAIGWAHVDMKKAKTEIRSLLSGQWSNGFIPQIIFHKESDSYYPGPEVHGAHRSPFYPKDIKTSGITQPPVLGFVLEETLRISNNKEIDFVKEVYDRVFDYSQYFYQYRDPESEGLVYICHNWEAGTDNTPVWDEVWKEMDSPDYDLPRKDNTHIDAENRPTNREYQHYIHLLELFKQWNYDDRLIAEKSPFLIQDPLFNAMLIASNQSLIRLGKQLGKHEQVDLLEQWTNMGIESFNRKLYDRERHAYVYYDLRNQKSLNYVSSSSFAPLFARIPSAERAKKMIETHFNTGEFSGKEQDFYLCASFDPTHERFDPKRYWRGPVWINLNWIVYRGCKRYGYESLAARIKADTIELIRDNGFYEYFDPRKEVQRSLGKGYGGNNFSWTAALLIDLLNETNKE